MYSFNERLEVAVAWLMTCNVDETAALTGIPARTIRDWKSQSWWESVLGQAKSDKQKELDALWTKVIHSAATKLAERLETGDETTDKFGVTHHNPVKAKDLAFILAVTTEKRANQRKLSDIQSTRKDNIQSDLNKLSKQLEEAGTTEAVAMNGSTSKLQ